MKTSKNKETLYSSNKGSYDTVYYTGDTKRKCIYLTIESYKLQSNLHFVSTADFI